MADQQGEPGIALNSTYGINTLISGLMDVQQVLRVIPSMQARIDSLTTENEKLKAQVVELTSSAVKVELAE
jgi:hypothetical protein